MKFWKQLIQEEQEDGTITGDCHRTCIACLLDVQPEDVPNFILFTKDGKEQHQAADKWLREHHGKCLIQVVYRETSLRNVLKTQSVLNPGVPYILSGVSEVGTGHCVVGRDDKIIHDPSDNGIVAPLKDADGDEWGYTVVYIGAKLN